MLLGGIACFLFRLVSIPFVLGLLDPELAAQGRRVVRDSVITLRSAASCSACRIELVPEVTLQLPADSLWFAASTPMTRTTDGKIIAQMRGSASPVVFSSDGKFDRVLMRTGDGPREIGTNGFNFLNAGLDGTLRVVDIAKAGSHVFRSDLRYLRFDRRVQYDANSALITRRRLWFSLAPLLGPNWPVCPCTLPMTPARS